MSQNNETTAISGVPNHSRGRWTFLPYSWSPRDWNAPHEKCSSLLGEPPSEIWRGFCIQSGHGKFEKRLLLLQNVIIKSIYLHIVVPKSALELRQSSASRGRKFYFRVKVNNNLKYERHGYLLHLNRWDNLVLWTCFLNLWLTVTAVQDSLICLCQFPASRQFFHLQKWFWWLLAANNCKDLLSNDFRSRERHSLRSTRPKLSDRLELTNENKL